MASFVVIQLDTTPPDDVTVSINGGAVYSTAQAVMLAIATSDPDTTGYTMKIWGDVDEAVDADVQQDEVDSEWITYDEDYAVTLSTGDGSKTINVKVRDDVWNVDASPASDSITLDTSLPAVDITDGPDPDKISKVATKDESVIVWESTQQYDEYKVKVVPANNSPHSAGTVIGSAGGSTNVSGSTPNQPAATPVTTTINGDDLEAAGAEGDNFVRVYVKDDAGNWSP